MRVSSSWSGRSGGKLSTWSNQERLTFGEVYQRRRRRRAWEELIGISSRTLKRLGLVTVALLSSLFFSFGRRKENLTGKEGLGVDHVEAMTFFLN